MIDRTPDAIRVPRGFAGAGDSQARLSRLQAVLAPILEVPRVFVRHQGTEHFVTGAPSDTLLYPSMSPRSGEARYVWEDRGDGILRGYLKDNA
jgi:hypothetical protein